MQDFVSPTQELVAHSHGNLERVRELLDTHPELVNARYEAWNESPLEAAAHTGSADIARLLLERGATPCHVAWAMLGEAGKLREMLLMTPTLAQTHGAHGIPLLFHAALSGRAEVVQVAWDGGARDGLDSAVLGATYVQSAEALRWLLERGAPVTATNLKGKTALEEALEGGWAEGAALLRAAGSVS